MQNNHIEEILQRLQATQMELAEEIDRLLEQKRRQFHYTVHRGRVTFERGMRELQRSYRQGLLRYILSSPLQHILTAPLIYAMIVPVVLVDLCFTLYQQICFRTYGIPRVRRSQYLVIDRHQLPYLNAIEKLNCVYCGYGNGVMAYAREIVARTEQFWCPIKHARRTRDPHHRTGRFVDYGDAAGYSARLEALRKAWDVDSTEG